MASCGVLHVSLLYLRTNYRNMPIIEITSLTHSGVEIFATLTEAQLRKSIEPEKGIFIAESPKVIRVALDAGYEPLALLCEQKHIEGDAADIVARCGDIPVYTGSRALLAELTGYTLTRGVLCAMRRPAPRAVGDICNGARRVVVVDGVVDTTNIGAIFRSAAALGIDAVLLTPTSCDPLNRRAVRVSMGSVFLVPWTWLNAPVSSLKEIGFSTAASTGAREMMPIIARAKLPMARMPSSNFSPNPNRLSKIRSRPPNAAKTAITAIKIS